jgi:hypothetical protein
MNKKQLIVAGLILCLTITTSGCALVGAALGAAISYGIYQATRK